MPFKELSEWMGRGGGLVVSVLAFYSNDPSSNPAGVFNFLYKKTKSNEKRLGLAQLGHDLLLINVFGF